MLDEVDHDVRDGRLRMSRRLSPAGTLGYLQALREAISTGTDQTLATALVRGRLLKWMEVRHAKNGRPFIRAVPRGAHLALAEADFNRFYIRALCVRAASDGFEQLQIYRAKVVDVPRLQSDAKIGTLIAVAAVLGDLQANVAVESALGVPDDPNAGLSLRLYSPREPKDSDAKARKPRKRAPGARARSVHQTRSC